MTANTAVIPSDANGKPVLALMNDATGQVVPVHVGSTVVGADGLTYAKLDVQASVTATPPASVVSTLNSTTALLTANSVFTGTSESALQYGSISVEVFADQASAAGGLVVQQSQDGINWDTKNTYSVLASTAFQATINLVGQFFQIKYTNGATNQGTFRLQTIKLPSQSPSGGVVSADVSDRWARQAGQVDIARVLGAAIGAANALPTANYIGGSAVGASNPYPSADTIRMLIQNGQGYTASVVGTTATLGNYVGLAFYTGGVGIAKNVFIYRVVCGSTQAGSLFALDFQTADYALGTAASAVNLKNGGGASLLSTFSSTLNATLAGTTITQGILPANQSFDTLQTSTQGYLIPANTQLSVLAAAQTKGATGTVAIQLWWVEY